MGIYTFRDSKGIVLFQFSTYQYIREELKFQNDLVSNLPLELLISINSRLIRALKSDSENVPNLEKDLIEMLSIDIRKSKLAAEFFYPRWVLSDYKSAEKLLVDYLHGQHVKNRQDGVFFTKSHLSMTFYALANQMKNARWFKQIVFQRTFDEIDRCYFEQYLDFHNRDLEDAYLSLYSEGEYFFTIFNPRTSVRFFIMVDDGMEPILIYAIYPKSKK